MTKLKVLVVFGTRPEAIKLCPLVNALRRVPDDLSVRTVVTGQHRSMLDQVLRVFQVEPDHDLDIMSHKQTLAEIAAKVLVSIEPILEQERPDVMLVQGDTTTTVAAAMAAFYRKIPLGHVEAGLRTGDPQNPFPEEMNRVLVTQMTSLHFTATQSAAENLFREGVLPSAVFVTGNTVIDALLQTRAALEAGRIKAARWPFGNNGRKLVLMTTHRRESFGKTLEGIFSAVGALANRSDVEVAFPVHRNPNVSAVAERMFRGCPNVHLLESLEYPEVVDLMARCHFVMTDSGGIQEEAPALGKPVLVLRETTERPEAVSGGGALLVGTEPDSITREACRLLEDPIHYSAMAKQRNIFGDGHACEQIATILVRNSDQIKRPGARNTIPRLAARAVAAGHPSRSMPSTA